MSIFKEEVQYIKELPKTDFLKRSKHKSTHRVLLVLLIWAPMDILLGFSSWELIAWAFPIIEEADTGIMENGLMEALITAVIMAPLLEEPIFRLILKFSRGRWNVSIFLLSLTMFFFSKYLAIAFLIAWAIIGIKLNDRYFYSRFLFGFLKYKKHLFWIIVLLFGFVHLSNFDLDMIYYYHYPLAVLPQLIAGVIFGIVRIRFGFWYAVLIHATNNAVAVFAIDYLGL